MLLALISCSPGQSSLQKKDFVLQIHTNQESYTKDESIQLWATLKYIGDAKEVTIDHASSYARFEIEQIDGSLRFVSGMDFSYQVTRVQKGIEYMAEYSKSGGYTSDDPNADIYATFYNEREVKLPPGSYKFKAQAIFEWYETEQTSIDPIYFDMPVELRVTIHE